MYLLRIKSDGSLSLTEYFGDENTPPYATLSHTWGEDGEEVTFEDVKGGLTESKVGYGKLSFCRDQAVSDGLNHIWVDTCCINKSSSAELSEAINSMYKWYKDAEKCYVYLSDVPEKNEQAFKESRWFTRGWTLQELVAPRRIEFFTARKDRLGDLRSLVKSISNITNIPQKVLEGEVPLSEVSIPERMSWMSMRKTKRPEDRVYSLLGIFDVHMPLIYGEGEAKAMRRLEYEIYSDYPEIQVCEKNFQTRYKPRRSRCSCPSFTIHGRTGSINVQRNSTTLNTGMVISNHDLAQGFSAHIYGQTGSISAGKDVQSLNTGIFRSYKSSESGGSGRECANWETSGSPKHNTCTGAYSDNRNELTQQEDWEMLEIPDFYH